MMSRIELMSGYRDLAAKIYSWESFSRRLRGFVSGVTRLPQVREVPLSATERANLLRVGSGDPVATAAVAEIVSHTERVAPTLLRRVRTLVLQHARHVETFQTLLPSIDRLVEQETSGQLLFPLDARPVPIPAAFRAVYDQMFLEVYRRGLANLNDTTEVPGAVTEVFVDFLVRWGDSFDGLGKHHRVFFDELCDRTCAKLNGTPPDQFQPRDAAAVSVTDAKRWRLAEDVIRNVEQELVRLAKQNGQQSVA